MITGPYSASLWKAAMNPSPVFLFNLTHKKTCFILRLRFYTFWSCVVMEFMVQMHFYPQ